MKLRAGAESRIEWREQNIVALSGLPQKARRSSGEVAMG